MARGVEEGGGVKTEIELSAWLYELANKLKYREVRITNKENRPDKTALVEHHTYVIASGLDRIEIRLRQESKAEDDTLMQIIAKTITERDCLREQVTALQRANNREVERRRMVEDRLMHATAELDDE